MAREPERPGGKGQVLPGTAVPDDDTPDGSITAYRMALRRARYERDGRPPSPVPGEVADEIYEGHQLKNRLVAIEMTYEQAIRAAWEDDPVAGPALRALATAADADEAAKAALKTARMRAGKAKHDGNRQALAAARAEVAACREARRVTGDAVKAAKAAVDAVRGERWHVAQAAISRAKDVRDAAVRAEQAAYPGFWATGADIVSYHKTAVRRVRQARKEGRPAQLRFRRFDGTGTVTVQVQREQGVTAAERQQVAAMKRAGLRAGEVSDALAAGVTESEVAAAACSADPRAAVLAAAERARAEGRAPGRTWTAQTIARMREDGKTLAVPDPPASAAELARPDSKYAPVLRLSPELPAGFAELRDGERRRLARQGRLTVRTGGGEHAALPEMGVVIHRPLRPDADVRYARVTVSRCGPDLGAAVSLTARVTPPAPRTGGALVCVHAGYRVLADGSLRVAVVSGAGPLPAGLAVPGGPAARPGMLSGTVRDLGGGVREVVIPAAWRDEHAALAKQRSGRDAALEATREAAARWLEEHPAVRNAGAGLPSPGMLRRQRAAGRLAALGRACAAGEHGDAARPLGELIGAWSVPDLVAWRAEARGRRHLIRRRDDLFAQAAAWIAAQAEEVRLDLWDMRDTSRRPRDGEEDDPQAAAARANRVLAAPGELRDRVRVTAGMAGCRVTRWEPGRGGQVHAGGCGARLPADARRESVTVTCPRCGQQVDQDVNMLALMRAAAVPA